MVTHTPKLLIDNTLTEFVSCDLKVRGNNTAAQLNFTVTQPELSYRKYWNKEVVLFFDISDATPIFRGRIVNSDIVDNIGLRFTAVDNFGFLTGHDKAKVMLTDESNVDGLSGGNAIKKLIQLANLDSVVGTDYIGDTNPIINPDKMRGDVIILDAIKSILKQVVNYNSTVTRENYVRRFDDGSKTQIKIDLAADLDNATPIKVYSYDNIITFKVNNRKIPTIINVKGDNSFGTYKHDSFIDSYGENPLSVDNKQLKSKAECVEFGYKIFEANKKNQYEYTIETADGVYLNEGDVVEIISDDVDVSGNFRIIGKSLSLGSNDYKLQLTINKQPPILSQFLL
tara:strand:- start:1908 stop:2930 length:1023 start_codon:yes stop_codon:yes gene_type:complete